MDALAAQMNNLSEHGHFIAINALSMITDGIPARWRNTSSVTPAFDPHKNKTIKGAVDFDLHNPENSRRIAGVVRADGWIAFHTFDVL